MASWQGETAMQTSSCQQQANVEYNHIWPRSILLYWEGNERDKPKKQWHFSNKILVMWWPFFLRGGSVSIMSSTEQKLIIWQSISRHGDLSVSTELYWCNQCVNSVHITTMGKWEEVPESDTKQKSEEEQRT